MKCEMCGICCKLFLINLNKEEYDSENFITVFQAFGKMEYKEASKCGANFLAKNKDGSCVYLKDKKCSIHEKGQQSAENFSVVEKKRNSKR